MPIFDYKCTNCGTEVKNHFVKRYDQVVVCPNEDCKEEMKKGFGMPALHGMNRNGSSTGVKEVPIEDFPEDVRPV